MTIRPTALHDRPVNARCRPSAAAVPGIALAVLVSACGPESPLPTGSAPAPATEGLASAPAPQAPGSPATAVALPEGAPSDEAAPSVDLSRGSSGEVAAPPAVVMPADVSAFEPIALGPRVDFPPAGSVEYPPGTTGAGLSPIPVRTSGAATRSASELFGPRCRGLVQEQPALSFDVTTPFRAVVEASASASGTVVVVAGRGTPRCAVAEPGQALRIEPLLVAGATQVFVGSLDGGTEAVDLRVSQGAASFARGACDATKTVVIDGAFEGATLEGDASATRGCESAFASAACGGFFGTSPGPCLLVTEAADIEVFVEGAGFDPVAAVLRYDEPSHAWNDDASDEGTAARVTMRLEPGLHTLHVGAASIGTGGTYSATVRRAVPLIAMAGGSECIDVGAGAALELTATTAQMRPCRTVVRTDCEGTLSNEAGACIRIATPTVVSVETAVAAFDAAVAFDSEGRRGWFDHGGEGQQAGFSATLAPGEYRLFVGDAESLMGGEYAVRLRAFAP
jgi:hypothetical protein